MTKTKNKSKAPKNVSTKQNGFFRALIVGVLVCVLTWLILSLIFAFVMSNMKDSHSLGGVFSPIIVVVSLAVGGYASGRADKSCAFLSAITLGCAFLGIGYAVSSALSLSKGHGSVMKTIIIVMMLVSPVIGARFSLSNGKKKRKMAKKIVKKM